MDRRELEIMLNEAFDRGIVSVGHLVHETVEVGFLNELGRTVGFTLNGWKEAIETIPVDLFDSFDDGRGRERFLSDCKALGGKVPQNTYRGELVSALADVLMVEEAAPPWAPWNPHWTARGERAIASSTAASTATSRRTAWSTCARPIRLRSA